MKTITTLLTTLLLSTFTACNSNPPTAEPPKTAKDEQTCQALGGKWERRGRLGNYGCTLPAKDAGKACTDSQQCEYKCLANRQPGGELPQAGQQASGQCQINNNPFGCKHEILGGIIQPGLCID